MKFWTEYFFNNEISISVPPPLDKYKSNGRIMSINKSCNLVTFQENCDHYFGVELTKDQAIELLEEAIKWVKSND